jgi:hypothetical protein
MRELTATVRCFSSRLRVLVVILGVLLPPVTGSARLERIQRHR